MSAPSYHSDPHVSFLTQILEEIQSGLIQIPRFQRPLVWGWEQRLELLRSIRDGIPMGAIMVWRSQVASFDCYKYLGPHRIDTGTNSNQYLLDGVQRLSTLVGALSPVTSSTSFAIEDEFDDQPPTEDFAVYFDFESNDFVRAGEFDSKSEVMPLNLVFDSVGMLRFQRELGEHKFEEKIKATEAIAKAFRQYKVPVIPIVTDDIDMATRTFQRINSQGQAMSEAHMIHALSWDKSFDLNKEIRQAKLKFLTKCDWQHIDDDNILKGCKTALGFGIYTKNADEIGRAFKENTEVVNQVAQSYSAVANFMLEYCGIPRPELTPYSLQLVILADIFRLNPGLPKEVLKQLRDWFWTTAYGEYFAGMSGDRFETALSDVHSGIESGNLRLTLFKPYEVRQQPEKFDFRSVRAKAFTFLLVRNINFARNDRTGFELLAEHGRECVLQPLPRVSLNKSIYSKYANRFVIDPAYFFDFKERLVSKALTDIEMIEHFLDDEMMCDLTNQDHEKFLYRRSELISHAEKEFLQKHLKGVSVPGLNLELGESAAIHF
jgi:hypothetical protein